MSSPSDPLNEMLASTLISRWIDRYHEVMEQVTVDYTPRELTLDELALFDTMADETLKVFREDLLAAWDDLATLHRPVYDGTGRKVCNSCQAVARGITHGSAGKLGYPCPTAIIVYTALKRVGPLV